MVVLLIAGDVFIVLYKYDLVAFVESFLIVLVPLGAILGWFLGLRGSLGVPWGSFWDAFWVPGGPWGSILAPNVNFGGTEGPSWTAGGSRGGSMVKKSLFPPPILGSFWDHFGIKNH